MPLYRYPIRMLVGYWYERTQRVSSKKNQFFYSHTAWIHSDTYEICLSSHSRSQELLLLLLAAGKSLKLSLSIPRLSLASVLNQNHWEDFFFSLFACVSPGPALGLGQLGHCLGPLTREGPKFGGKSFYIFIYFLYINIFERY